MDYIILKTGLTIISITIFLKIFYSLNIVDEFTNSNRLIQCKDSKRIMRLYMQHRHVAMQGKGNCPFCEKTMDCAIAFVKEEKWMKKYAEFPKQSFYQFLKSKKELDMIHRLRYEESITD